MIIRSKCLHVPCDFLLHNEACNHGKGTGQQINDTTFGTLTCTSTGGPPTTVSWRRDGTMLSDDSTYSITSQVTDTETATYTHTLTVTGRLGNWWRLWVCISVMCPTSGHIQEVPEA